MQLSMIPIILVSAIQPSRDSYIDTYIKSIELPAYRVFIFTPQETIITIEQARDITTLINRSDYDKIVVIHDFDTAKKETQNALLKTLEEHADSTHFFLTVVSLEALLPTIQSRCQTVRLPVVVSKKKSASLFNASYSLEEALNDSSKIKKADFLKETHKIISYLRMQLHDGISKEMPISEINHYSSSLRTALEVKKMIAEYNVQPEFAFDQVLLQLYDKPST